MLNNDGELKNTFYMDDNNNWVISQEIMMKIIDHYEEKIEKLESKLPEEQKEKSLLRSNYCCVLYADVTDEIIDHHQYCEDLKEVAQFKCKKKLGSQAKLENGHCCHYVEGVECDDC